MQPAIRTLSTVLLATSLLLAACASSSSRTSGPQAGTPAPQLSATDLNGQPFDLQEHRGKVVFIDFWATWCPPCVQASPHIQALHEKYPDVEIVAVHASSKGEPAEYAAEHGYTYRIIPNGADIARQWNVSSFPTFVVLDRNGNVAYNKLGFYKGDQAKLDKAISDAL